MRKTRNTNKRNAGDDIESEKISSGDKKKDQVDEISSTENKKMTTVPLKKRPLPMKKIIERKPILKEDLTPTIAAGRSKRTPKPNPKYSNETMVTSQLRSKKNRFESSEDEDLVDEDDLSELNSEHEENNSDDTFNEFENEDDEDIDDIDFLEKIPVNRKSGIINQKRQRGSSPNRITTSTPLSRPGLLRGRPKRSINPLEKYSTSGQPIKHNVEFEKKKQKVESSIIERNKRLNIALFDSSDKEGTKNLQTNIKEFKMQQARQMNNRNRQKSSTPDPVSIVPTSDLRKRNIEENLKRGGKPMPTIQRGLLSKKDDHLSENSKTNTQDDFETMPTFTIVNVDDIMNNREILVADSKSVNRSKERHIPILSDTSDDDNLLARKPFPPKKSSNYLNNNNLSKMETRKGDKGAPIILNSLLGNNVAQVAPKINKNMINSNLRPIKSHRNVSNIKSEVNKPLKHPFPTTQRVVFEREGDQLVKKITCYESWYIIDIPEEEPPPPPKNLLDISLVQIGNAAKEIKLPSVNWKHKVTLQQIPENIMVRGDYEEYTGDLVDLGISEDDREKYQPTSVMFKRAASEKEKARLPYDRAVIFKNNTFFTNIDGKNIRLIGAPNNISSLEDIEVLIQLIDELPLDSQFVEPTTTI